MNSEESLYHYDNILDVDNCEIINFVKKHGIVIHEELVKEMWYFFTTKRQVLISENFLKWLGCMHHTKCFYSARKKIAQRIENNGGLIHNIQNQISVDIFDFKNFLFSKNGTKIPKRVLYCKLEQVYFEYLMVYTCQKYQAQNQALKTECRALVEITKSRLCDFERVSQNLIKILSIKKI
jgi:hypothetical protein